MPGIADGNVGIWDLTGLDALHVACDYARTVVILDPDNLPTPLDISWAVTLESEIRVGRPQDPTPGALIATAAVSFTTDGTNGSIEYEVAASELVAAEARTDLRVDVIGVDGSGGRWKLLTGRAHVRPTSTGVSP